MTVNKELYGISGYKGHGKDTFAKYVKKSNNSFKIVHFADCVKQISIRVFGLTEYQVYDSIGKESLLSSPIKLDDFLPAMESEIGLNLIKRGKIAHTPREVLQFFGTDYVRSIKDDYWIQRLMTEIQDHQQIIVCDVRFINEAEIIKNNGGSIIKIQRSDMLNTDKHLSEIEIDQISPDLLLHVMTGDTSLSEKVAQLIADNKFEKTHVYDYRKMNEVIRRHLLNDEMDLDDLKSLTYAMLYYDFLRKIVLHAK